MTQAVKLTQDGVAEEFVRRNVGVLAYHVNAPGWCRASTDGEWALLRPDDALHEVRMLCREMNTEGRAAWGSLAFARAVLRLAECDPAIRIDQYR